MPSSAPILPLHAAGPPSFVSTALRAGMLAGTLDITAALVVFAGPGSKVTAQQVL